MAPRLTLVACLLAATGSLGCYGERLDQINRNLMTLANAIAAPDVLKAPESCFWIGPREAVPGQPYMVQMLCNDGKPAVQLVPFVPQGPPRSAAAAPTPEPKGTR